MPACRVGCGSAPASPAVSGPRPRANGFCSAPAPRRHRPGWLPASAPRMGPAPAGDQRRTTSGTRFEPQRNPRLAQEAEDRWLPCAFRRHRSSMRLNTGMGRTRADSGRRRREPPDAESAARRCAIQVDHESAGPLSSANFAARGAQGSPVNSIAVLGATGSLGNHVARQALAAGLDLSVMVRTPAPRRSADGARHLLATPRQLRAAAPIFTGLAAAVPWADGRTAGAGTGPAAAVGGRVARPAAAACAPCADAAACMLAHTAPGGPLAQRRVGLALPEGMRGRKDQWATQPQAIEETLKKA